jgi:hypothetical protein
VASYLLIVTEVVRQQAVGLAFHRDAGSYLEKAHKRMSEGSIIGTQ